MILLGLMKMSSNGNKYILNFAQQTLDYRGWEEVTAKQQFKALYVSLGSVPHQLRYSFYC